MRGGIGLFGGTFDPVHLAHLRVAEEVCEAESLDELRFIPAAIPPHKLGARISPAAHRVRMLELAIAGSSRFRVWPIELSRTGPSFTVDTVAALRDEVGPTARILLIMGRDQFAEFHTWQSPERIAGLCDLLIVSRPPGLQSLDLRTFPVVSSGTFCYDSGSDRFVHASGHSVSTLAVTPLDIAATQLRSAIRAHRSIKFLVPAAVEDYIHTHRLYSEDVPH